MWLGRNEWHHLIMNILAPIKVENAVSWGEGISYIETVYSHVEKKQTDAVAFGVIMIKLPTM